MKPYHKNPRCITDKQLLDLKTTLQELGDINGVVHDINTNEIIGGNQRSKVFDVNTCKITITKKYIKPSRTGTVAEGYITWQGERYSYRRVNWTAEQCMQACVIANKAGGDWDWDVLVDDFQAGDLKNWGFADKELKIFGEQEDRSWGDLEDSWFLNIEFETEMECRKWFEKLTPENLKMKIVQ